MPRNSSIFRTAEGEAKYRAAYDATLGLWPVSCESLQVQTRFGVAHIIASGSENAPPMVLLHMMSTSATMWFPNVADLSRDYRVYAVDTMNDLGKSVPSQPTRNRSTSAEWLLDVLDALGIDRACIVGASYGGWLTLNLVIHAPERVKRIALLAPAGSFKSLSWKFFATLGPAAVFPFKSVLRIATRPMTAKGFVWNEFLLEQLRLGLRYRRVRSLFDLALPTVFSDDELRRINTPTLLLLGDNEIIYNPQAALKRATRLIPNIDAEIIPGVGHGLSQEQPELVNSRILEFLTEEA